MSFRFTAIPRDYRYGGPLAFNREEMRALFEYGRSCAAQRLIWVDPRQALARAELADRALAPENTLCPLLPAAEQAGKAVSGATPSD